jgi:hypothetical protein
MQSIPIFQFVARVFEEQWLRLAIDANFQLRNEIDRKVRL